MSKTKIWITILLIIGALLFIGGMTAFILVSKTNNGTNGNTGVPFLILLATMITPMIFGGIISIIWKNRPQ